MQNGFSRTATEECCPARGTLAGHFTRRLSPSPMPGKRIQQPRAYLTLKRSSPRPQFYRSSLGEMQRDGGRARRWNSASECHLFFSNSLHRSKRVQLVSSSAGRTTAALSGTAHSCCGRFAYPDAQRQREHAMVRSSLSAVPSEPKTLHASERPSEARETSSSISPLLLPNSLKKRI